MSFDTGEPGISSQNAAGNNGIPFSANRNIFYLHADPRFYEVDIFFRRFGQFIERAAVGDILFPAVKILIDGLCVIERAAGRERRARFLDLSKDNYTRRGIPTQRGTAARRDRRPACPMADRGRGLARPTCGAGVYRSFSVERSHRAPAARLSVLTQGCRHSLASGRKPPLINRDIFSSIPSGLRRKNQKVFFMRSRPRLIDWRTDSSCTPSASAIALMLMPRMI